MSKISLFINDREIKTSSDKTILQAAVENGIEIPNLCYDERLKPYGACGLCVVEVEGNPKLQRACSVKVQNGMVIYTNTDRTITARKTALSLLASDHRGDCRPPCVIACPAHTDCQGYVGLVANGEFDEALKLVKDKIPLPASIGRVCPHPCEEECRRNHVEAPIAIAEIKRFLGDMSIKMGGYIPEVPKETGKRIAVVGSGPSGISCAYFLALKGHHVIVYEAMPKAGGMLRYGIPEYRLPKEILDSEIEMIKRMGIEFKTNTRLGVDVTLDYLRNNYDSVFLALGAWKSVSIGCPGEDVEGVMGGIEFLRKAAMNMPINMGDDLIIIGGGNTAMDAGRTAVRLGAKSVSVLYRRTREEMPAEDVEIKEAEEEGVEFRYLTAPIEIIDEAGRARAVRCQRMRLGNPDESGRRRPEPIPGEEEIIKGSLIVKAIGQMVEVGDVKGLSVSKRGNVIIDENTHETNFKGVFAGGEVVTGPKIAIAAIAEGKAAAEAIDGYLNGYIAPHHEPQYITQDDLRDEDFKDRERIERVKKKVVPVFERRISFRPISETMTIDEAVREAKRCLECGCLDYLECKLIRYIQEYDVNPNEIKSEKRNRKEEQKHPFIQRNPDKCVLCGLCIRVCDEVLGITALGLEARGFETQVKPEFGMPLEETACINCGQCADICPTGACMEVMSSKKPVPVELKRTASVCSGCGVGCRLFYESRGNVVFRVTPDRSSGEGLLCSKGKFCIDNSSDNRILKPAINKDGIHVEAQWNEAISLLVKRLQLVRGKYDKDSIGFLVSPSLSNEEAFIIKRIAQSLDTKILGSLSFNEASPLKTMLGYDASPNSFDEIYETDLVISFGQIAENYPVIGAKMKLAAEKGVKLISISENKTRLQEWADKAYIINKSTRNLKGVVKVLINLGYTSEEALSRILGYEEFKEALRDAEDTPEIIDIARSYGEAKKAMLVIDEDSITSEGIRLIAAMALITGKIGKPYRGIVLLRSKSNTQGLIDMGIDMPGREILNMIAEGKIKGLVVIGEDPIGAEKSNIEILKKLDFLGAFDLSMTKTASMAEVILPMAGHEASEGTYTRGDRRIQSFYAVIASITGKTNLEILLDMAQDIGIKIESLSAAREAISIEISGYGGLSKANFADQIYCPNSHDDIKGKQILYTQGIATKDGKAHLNRP